MSDLFDTQVKQFKEAGWLKLGFDDDLFTWASHALPTAQACLEDSQHKHWWRYQDTWFVGVNVLSNDRFGRISNGPQLRGSVTTFMRGHLDTNLGDLDAAQVSAIFPGYPLPNIQDDEPGFQYRLKRDAAHVDGLLRLGESGERFAMEYHQYILAIPLNKVSRNASPLVVWSGSQQVMRERFRAFFAQTPTDQWPKIAINTVYEETRRDIFKSQERVEIPLVPGEALLLDRHMLHGTATWTDNSSTEGRLIAFFRPQFLNASAWL